MATKSYRRPKKKERSVEEVIKSLAKRKKTQQTAKDIATYIQKRRERQIPPEGNGGQVWLPSKLETRLSGAALSVTNHLLFP